jgi:PIN domain nuclease of toxin-antitoxin system
MADMPHLTKRQIDIIEDNNNVKLISYISLWEITVKSALGKLQIATNAEGLVPDGMHIIYPDLSALRALATLPMHHRDPFDRMIIAQAISEGLTVMSNDSNFSLYPIHLL